MQGPEAGGETEGSRPRLSSCLAPLPSLGCRLALTKSWGPLGAWTGWDHRVPSEASRIREGTDAVTRPSWEVRGPGIQGHPQARHTTMLLPLGYILQDVLGGGGSFNGKARVSTHRIPFKGQQEESLPDTRPQGTSPADGQDNLVHAGYPTTHPPSPPGQEARHRVSGPSG